MFICYLIAIIYDVGSDTWSIAEEKLPGDGFGFAPVVQIV